MELFKRWRQPEGNKLSPEEDERREKEGQLVSLQQQIANIKGWEGTEAHTPIDDLQLKHLEKQAQEIQEWLKSRERKE